MKFVPVIYIVKEDVCVSVTATSQKIKRETRNFVSSFRVIVRCALPNIIKMIPMLQSALRHHTVPVTYVEQSHKNLSNSWHEY